MNQTLIRSKVIAERGKFFYDIFDNLPYEDLDSETLSRLLNQQMSEWEDYQKNNEDKWVSEVRSQLKEMSEPELEAFYDSICDEKQVETRLVLHRIFREHRTLHVDTQLFFGSEFPKITISTDHVYQDDAGDYHESVYEPQGSENWNYDYDCSWEDFLSYAEYDG